MFNKIFCIGFNKTGTSSLHQLFLVLGLRSLHGYYHKLPVTDPLFAAYQCFSDGNGHDFALLDRSFPGSRFILTSRPLEDWLVSRIRHVEQRRAAGQTGPMRREYEADPVHALERWITQRLDFHRRAVAQFAGRPADLLVVDLCSGADPEGTLATLLGFLGLPARPGQRLPHENAQSSVGGGRPESEVRAEVRARLREAGLAPAQWQAVFP